MSTLGVTAEFSRDTTAFLQTFKAAADAQPSAFPSEHLGVAQQWSMPLNFNEHDLKHFILERKDSPELIEKMFSIITEFNPQLRKIELDTGKREDAKFHILFGVASRFNIDDIRFFVEQGGQYTAPEIEKYAILKEAYGVKIEHIPSPETLSTLCNALPRPLPHQQDCIGKIQRVLAMHGPEISEYQDALIGHSFRFLAWDGDKHSNLVRHALEGLREGDVLSIEEQFYKVKKTDLPSNQILLEKENGEVCSFAITDLLSRLDKLAPYQGYGSSSFGKHYSDYPNKLLPHHYIVEEQINVFKGLNATTTQSSLFCAKAASKIGEIFREAFVAQDHETGKPLLAMNHVAQVEVEGAQIALVFLQKEKQFYGPSSVETLPIVFSDRDGNTQERCREAIEIIEAAVLAPPETDGELTALLSQLAELDLRPKYKDLLLAVREHPNVNLYSIGDNEAISTTAAIEIARLVQSIENLPEISPAEAQKLGYFTKGFLNLFTGESALRQRSWGQEVGNQEFASATKADFDIPTDIDFAKGVKAVGKFAEYKSYCSNSDSSLSYEEFWHFAKEAVFCRCDYEQTYLLLSNLNENGRANLKHLFDSGVLVITEDIFKKPGLDNMLKVLNEEKNLQSLSDFCSAIAVKNQGYQSPYTESIRLGYLIDARNKAGFYCVLGSSAWNNYPQTPPLS